MSKKITLKEIISLNPQINKDLLKKAQELAQKLQRAGTIKREYNLISPYYHRHKPMSKKGDLDPRTVHIGRSSSR